MKFVAGFFCISWTLLFLLSVNTGLGDTPLRFNQTGEDAVKSILPQGWGFFSKDPRDEEVMIYPVNNEANEVLFPTMRLENLFGIARTGRSQAIEMGTVINTLEDKHWFECGEKSISKCESKVTTVYTVENTSGNPLLCGNYIITKENITPWSYSAFDSTDMTINQIAKGEITCTKS